MLYIVMYVLIMEPISYNIATLEKWERGRRFKRENNHLPWQEVSR